MIIEYSYIMLNYDNAIKFTRPEQVAFARDDGNLVPKPFTLLPFNFCLMFLNVSVENSK